MSTRHRTHVELEPAAPMYDDIDKDLAGHKWKRSLQITGTSYSIRHDGAGRYYHGEGLDDESCFRLRETTVALFKAEQYIGFLEFYSYKFNEDRFDPKLFAYEMDAIDGDTYELGLMIAGCWTERQFSEIIMFGYLLEFHRVWVRPEFRPCFGWVEAAEQLMRTMFKGHALMVMCAAPMEIEHEARKQAETQDGRAENHRKHMIRAYKRLFGVDSLPGEFGDDGWLWRAAPGYDDVIAKPRFSRRIDPYDR